jgi:hypothetical protein
MKNLLTYEEFLNESIPSYSFDGNELKVGTSVQSLDGFSGIVVSKEITNGKISFRDSKGIIHICESNELILNDLNEGLKWWEITKGILASDALKTGINFAGGGLSLASHLFPQWRLGIVDKIEKLRGSKTYQTIKNVAFPLADKINNDSNLHNLVNKLANRPHVSTVFSMSSKEKNKAEKNNLERKSIMIDITKYVDSILTDEERKFFKDINNILKPKALTDEDGIKVEEDVTTDPNRTVGTGTYTSTHSDPNVLTKGYSNTTDSGSNGSYPVYIS